MNPNLTPEQRADKNGTVVTRWVRNMISPKSSRHTIPRVAIDTVSTLPTKRDSKKIYDRLMATLPQGKVMETLAESGTLDDDLSRKMRDRDCLKSAFNSNRHDLLPLFEKFGERHTYAVVKELADMISSSHIDSEVTDENLAAYSAFRATLKRAIIEGQQRERVSLPLVFHAGNDLSVHVIKHPEDGEMLGAILGQGISDKGRIMSMLAEMKAGNLQPVLSDGFL